MFGFEKTSQGWRFPWTTSDAARPTDKHPAKDDRPTPATDLRRNDRTNPDERPAQHRPAEMLF